MAGAVCLSWPGVAVTATATAATAAAATATAATATAATVPAIFHAAFWRGVVRSLWRAQALGYQKQCGPAIVMMTGPHNVPREMPMDRQRSL
jgi:hypothetical protein